MPALRQKQIFIIAGGILTCLLAFLIVKDASSISTNYYLAIIIGFAVLAITFSSPPKALYLIVVAVLFSPEFSVAKVGSRELSIRIEDIIIFCMTIGWLARFSLYKGLGLIIKTPLNKPILIYSFAVLVSTLIGIIFYNAALAKSLLYFLKYMEYFFLFFLVLHNIQSVEHAHKLILLQLIVCLISGLYGYSQIGSGRVHAPFDPGEANTYGGYLMMMFSFLLGFILYSQRRTIKWSMAIALVLLLPPFLFTLSRSSYMALVAMFSVHILMYKRKHLLVGLLTIMLVVLFFNPDLLPETVTNRLSSTATVSPVQGQGRVSVFDITLDASASERLISWVTVVNAWMEYPLFGKGVTNFGFIDGQYFVYLIDMGIVGLGTFVILLIAIYKILTFEFRHPVDRFHQSISSGLRAAFVGLMVHAISSNTFIIIRIMEPFWFLMAVTIIYSKVYDMKNAWKPIPSPIEVYLPRND